MKALDLLLALYLFLLTFNGFRRGLIASLLHLAGILCAFLLVGRYAPLVKEGLVLKWHFGPLIASITAYLLVLVGLAVVVQLIRFGLERAVHWMRLGGVNKALGALFGFLNGLLLLTVLVAIIHLLPVKTKFDTATKNSYVLRNVRVVETELQDMIRKHPQRVSKASKLP